MIPIAASDEIPNIFPASVAKTIERITDKAMIAVHFKYFTTSPKKYSDRISRYLNIQNYSKADFINLAPVKPLNNYHAHY